MSKCEPNRSSVSPLSRDILCILEEAGEEDLGCIINTIIIRKDDPQNTCWLSAIANSLGELLKEDYIEIPDLKEIMPKSEVQPRKYLESLFRFDNVKAMWIWREEPGQSKSIPNVAITLQGFDLISQILREEGWPSTLM